MDDDRAANDAVLAVEGEHVVHELGAVGRNEGLRMVTTASGRERACKTREHDEAAARATHLATFMTAEDPAMDQSMCELPIWPTSRRPMPEMLPMKCGPVAEPVAPLMSPATRIAENEDEMPCTVQTQSEPGRGEQWNLLFTHRAGGCARGGCRRGGR